MDKIRKFFLKFFCCIPSNIKENEESLVVTASNVQENTEAANKPNDSPECKNCSSVVRNKCTKATRRRYFKARVRAAVVEKKIFWADSIVPDIRRGLLRRGWTQKLSPTFSDNAMATLFSVPCRTDYYQSRVHYNVQPNFVWTYDDISPRNLNNDQMLSDFMDHPCFVSKVGMCTSLKKLYRFAGADPYTFYPRCYVLEKREERQAFIDDFRMTAARSILKWVVRTNEPETRRIYRGRNVVPEAVIWAALVACKLHLNTLEHRDIDRLTKAKVAAHWKILLRDYYQVMHHGAHIQNSQKYVEQCRRMLQRLEPLMPQLNIDGEKNIWILKPGYLSRGRGIHCRNRLDRILRVAEPDFEWVAQKYIERPLLVYGTKIDLRQHFLITDWNPLTIWFYKDSFIRFSSQPFTVECLDRSIHVCNNAIQRHLKNASYRNPHLPEENMWHSDEFQYYLRSIGKEHVWDSIIIPGMKRALIHAVQVAQDTIRPRKNSFDLYGADFMFDKNFQPWLLEVNFKPDINKDTSVMTVLIPPMIESLLCVLIDRKTDPDCDVGGFELIYKQTETETPKRTRR
ncbi:tubulin monoglycylase TTLL3 [Xenopus tropicalis]|uniref:Tubulin monoglycylase TTLL3 n=1 Tax=Xenopus tropicalis TaxID=8364 RepID=A0A8J1J828_XENTR|nr:tubulin monoglycylase TTLL3 [Xenopus tropicalis]